MCLYTYFLSCGLYLKCWQIRSNAGTSVVCTGWFMYFLIGASPQQQNLGFYGFLWMPLWNTILNSILFLKFYLCHCFHLYSSIDPLNLLLLKWEEHYFSLHSVQSPCSLMAITALDGNSSERNLMSCECQIFSLLLYWTSNRSILSWKLKEIDLGPGRSYIALPVPSNGVVSLSLLIEQLFKTK